MLAPTEAGNPLSTRTDPGASLGVDLKYAVTPALTLTATLNPDFGQVEADPAVVNLDAFELFFHERRPFFVEGSGIFRFNMDCNDGECTGLLYSRRIGRAPQGDGRDEVDGEYSQAPAAATILGAAKLTGRVGRVLGRRARAPSRRRSGPTSRPASSRRRQVVEPLTGFNVLRARREFANNSNLGVMLTTTNRRLTADTRFLAAAAPSPAASTTTGASGADYSLSGFWAGSRVRRQTPKRSRACRRTPCTTSSGPTPTTSTLDDGGDRAERARRGAELRRRSAASGCASAATTATRARASNQRPRLPAPRRRAHDEPLVPVARQHARASTCAPCMVNFNQWAGWNFDGDRLFSGGNINMHWTWQNNWRTGFGVNLNAGGVRDRSTRGGPAVPVQPQPQSLALHRPRQPPGAVPRLQRLLRRRRSGHADSFEANPRLTWRPSRALRLEAGVRFTRNNDDAQWVENVDRCRRRAPTTCSAGSSSAPSA